MRVPAYFLTLLLLATLGLFASAVPAQTTPHRDPVLERPSRLHRRHGYRRRHAGRRHPDLKVKKKPRRMRG